MLWTLPSGDVGFTPQCSLCGDRAQLWAPNKCCRGEKLLKRSSDVIRAVIPKEWWDVNLQRSIAPKQSALAPHTRSRDLRWAEGNSPRMGNCALSFQNQVVATRWRDGIGKQRRMIGRSVANHVICRDGGMGRAEPLMQKIFEPGEWSYWVFKAPSVRPTNPGTRLGK
jgi:hypothetical protein